MAAPNTDPTRRLREFQTTDGFALYTDVNDQAMDTIAARFIPRLAAKEHLPGLFNTFAYGKLAHNNPAGMSLFMTAKVI